MRKNSDHFKTPLCTVEVNTGDEHRQLLKYKFGAQEF